MPKLRNSGSGYRPQSTRDLRRQLKRFGVSWPGDGGYGFGTLVYLVKSRAVVRLTGKLPEAGTYSTEHGGVYTEKKTTLGFSQGLSYPDGMKTVAHAEESFYADVIAKAYVAYVEKCGEMPTVLHISYDDLVKLGQERSELAQSGDAWGLTISLVPRGEAASVDRRLW